MHPLTVHARDLFIANANADRALQMKRYMKDNFAFFGITSPEIKELKKQLVCFNGFPTDKELEVIVRELWDQPERELHHLALDFLDKRAGKDGLDWLPLMEYLVTHNSWWDTVDHIATRLAGPYFSGNTEKVRQVTARWMNSGNMWLQRTCILFQLKYRSKTDEDLLFKYITHCSSSSEFFIQKAIGWALREYSKTNSKAVCRFIGDQTLAPLSKREGLKWLKNQGVQVTY